MSQLNKPASGDPSAQFSGRRDISSFEVHEAPAPSTSSTKWVVIIAVGALGLAAFGIGRELFLKGEPKVAIAAAPVETYLSEQTRMMREAMSMAKEAQQLQRENLMRMHQEMSGAYQDAFMGQQERDGDDDDEFGGW